MFTDFVSSALVAQAIPVYFGPGGYLSLVKLLLIVFVFLVWVRLADWINRDSLYVGERTGLKPVIWNPLNVGVFFLGFMIAISLPVFAAGYPIYLICAFTPPVVYLFLRAGKLKENPDIRSQLKTKKGIPLAEPGLPQDEGVAVDFSAAGADTKTKQINLIRARQSPGFLDCKHFLVDTLNMRADTALLDFTRQQVNSRLQIDGTWHPVPAQDRPTGDAILSCLKYLAGLNPNDRRSQQTGSFSLKTETHKVLVELSTQGVKTGERAQLKLRRKNQKKLTLGQLGMFPDMLEQLQGSLNQPALTIISARPGEGLTSSWQGALTLADRLSRDCVAIISKDENETAVENIALKRYENGTPKTQLEVLKSTLLTQPDLIVCSQIEDPSVMDQLTQQVLTQERTVILRTPARSAAEGLLKMASLAGNRGQFANAVKHVTGQRLVRRLCDHCKQEVRVPPKIIQQLGGNPNKQTTLFNQYQLPPPEQRVDQKGKPIEFPPCETCGGIGYVGRIAVFELLEINDSVKSALASSPNVEAIERAALQTGKKTIAQQAYQLILMGVTSRAEVQRMMKN